MVEVEIRENVEQPRVVWLSSSDYAKLESSRTLQDQIKDIVEHLHISADVNDCEHFIRGIHGHPQYEQIFLIVTIDYIHQILQRHIHDVRVLQAIFVFNQNNCDSFSTFKQYSKIDGVYCDPKDLLIQFSKSVDDFSHDSGVLLSTLKGCDVGMTTNIINNFADFSELWYPLFLDLLFDLPKPSDVSRAQEVQHFAEQCRRFHAHNKVILAQIDDFFSSTNGYSSDNAVQYYTRASFLFNRVNKVLRQQNVQAILDFRFFLLDMQAQLQKAYAEFSGRYWPGETMEFYRGQRMSREEMDLLKEKRRTGSLITVNSYLSTSNSRDIAKNFIQNSLNDALIPVLFQIKAEFKDPNVVRRKPFAFISHLSYFGEAEQEVLFSVGSFFRVDEIRFDQQLNIHIIELTFIYDEDHHIITDDYSKLKACSMEEKLVKTADLLSNHVKHGVIKAKALYQHFLSDHYSPQINAACHAGLGWLAFKEKQFDLAMQYQEQALKKYEAFQDETCLIYLYITSYNCIGAIYQERKQYSEALSSYGKAYEIHSNAVSIDKYAFYNSFRNVASVNIACIHKIQGDAQRAWSTYKDILAYEMDKSTRFHGATYLTIAEAGFSEIKSLSSNDEQMEYIANWKRFLDFSLTDMSSSYRRSVVSGALSIGLRLANNEQTGEIAIDYYQKIIQISQKYVDVSIEDHSIVIQCYQQIAEFYRKKGRFADSVKYAFDGLKLCDNKDLEYIVASYASMTKTYEQQLRQLNSSLNPPDSSSLDNILCLEPQCQPIVLHFERSEFSFGQYRKALNLNLFKEPNLARCLTYCRLKLSALHQEQGKLDGARNLLDEARGLILDDPQVQSTCDNNRNYLDGEFDRIIDVYRRSLDERQSDDHVLCIGEDAFCYIAFLYSRKNDTDAEQQWYTRAITYFEEKKFVCEHTQ